jgi:cytochrome b6-f complex iron-sulfur subunit
MSTGTLLVIAIAAIVVLAGLFLITAARRGDRNAATGLLAREAVKRDRKSRREKKAADTSAPPAATGRAFESMALARREGGAVVQVAAAAPPDLIRPPMDADELGVTRRKFLNRSIVVMFTAGIGAFGAAVLAFLWPQLSAGFGAKVKLGLVDDIRKDIEAKKEPKYFPEARTYITLYPTDSGTLAKAKKAYSAGVYAGMEEGVAAIYQKCVHLGCKVPWCGNSQWFECPCHGSQYNRVGERKGGPAPRGLDRFDLSVSDGILTVDTGGVRIGPPDGTNTTGQEAEGPHCVGGGH